MDIACSCRGWWADSAVSFGVGTIDEKRQKLLRGAWLATRTAIGLMTPGEDGRRTGEAIADICRTTGLKLVEEGAGHGLGRRLHEAPSLVYDGETHDPLRTNRVYTAEPILSTGTGLVRISESGIAVTQDREPTAHFEASVLVLPHGIQVLGDPDWLHSPPC